MNLSGSLGTVVRSTRPQAAADFDGLAPARAESANRTKHQLAGYGCVLTTMKFMRWAIEQDRFPTVAAVMTQFGVCKATAYRWTAALAEAYGIDPAIRHGDQS